MVHSSTFYLYLCIPIIHSCFALTFHSCIRDSLTIYNEQNAFTDLFLKEKNLIFMNLIFNQSNSDEFIENKKLERWVWVADDYRYILSYPEDVDVFSFGLLKAEQDSLNVEINIGNLTEACMRHFNYHLAQYISKVVRRNSSVADNVINASEGYICHSKLEKDSLKQKVSELSAVQFGYSFWCFTDNNTTMVVEKSYVNYIVVFIILFAYSFYPLAIESAFYIEDKKMVQGSYYMSDSPYSPSVLCKRILFSGNNKYLATLRIITFVTALTTFVYLIKSHIDDRCNCSLKSSNDDQSFQDAENIYNNNPLSIILGILNFLLVNISVLVNSDGILDDFLILDFTNVFENSMFIKTLKVSVFLSNGDKGRNQNGLQTDQKKSLVSQKIKKIFLILSFSFWSKLFINSSNQNNTCLRLINIIVNIIICFPINICLVLTSTFCPLVSTVYLFFIKYLNVFIGKLACALIKLCFAKENRNKENAIIRTEEIDIELHEEELGENRKTPMTEMINRNDEQLPNKENAIIRTEEKNMKLKEEEPPGEKRNKPSDCFLQFVSHACTIAYLVLTYMYSFNIFFYGMSYVIQFFIFTLLLAVPHFSIQSYIYIIFSTSVVIYISRFVFHFIKLYKSLLEKILEIQEQTSIPIRHFDKVVARHFPLSNEIFYLFVKITLSVLFFAIIYDTMQNVSYIRFGAQPDLTTIISLIFLFGPPRLVEALLTTDFTSRVHMKEKEIKEELENILLENNTEEFTTFKTMSLTIPVLTVEERDLSCIKTLKKIWEGNTSKGLCRKSEKSKKCCSCIEWCKTFCQFFAKKNYKKSSCFCIALCKKLCHNSKSKKCKKSCCFCNAWCKRSCQKSENCKYRPGFFWLRWIGMFCCGCCNFSFDRKGNCVCCFTLTTNSKSKETTDSSYCTIPCVCVKNCLNEDNTLTTDEKIKLIKTDTLYKITVDTVDEIRPSTIYRVKAEVLNKNRKKYDEFGNERTSDLVKDGKQDKISERNETCEEQSKVTVNTDFENEDNTKTKSKVLISEKIDSEHDEEKTAGSARISNTVDEKSHQDEISDSNETGNEKRVQIVNESPESEPCTKPTVKGMKTRIYTLGTNQPSLTKEKGNDCEVCTETKNASRTTAIIEGGVSKPNFDKEENDDQSAFDNNESEHQKNRNRERKDTEDTENKVGEHIELATFQGGCESENEIEDKPKAKEN